MSEFWVEGGFWMYPIAALGLASVVLGAVGLANGSKGAALGGLTCAAVVMLMGVSGMMSGRMQVDRALEMVNPADAELIRVQGYKEANRPLQLAGGFVVFGALLGLAGFTRGQQR